MRHTLIRDHGLDVPRGGILAADPGLTTGIAYLNSTGLHIYEVSFDELPELSKRIGIVEELVVEAYTAYGSRSAASTAALRVDGFLWGMLATWSPDVKVSRPPPASRYPKMSHAAGMLHGSDVRTPHTIDALAHLLVALDQK